MSGASWTAAEIALLRQWRAAGRTRAEISADLGRTPDAVRKAIEHHAIPLGPRPKAPRPPKPRLIGRPEFARRCREIVETMRGHAAHRALDLLTNEVLAGLGYRAGVDIFEAAVALWHRPGDPYPYQGPCPVCEASAPQPRPQIDQQPGLPDRGASSQMVDSTPTESRP